MWYNNGDTGFSKEIYYVSVAKINEYKGKYQCMSVASDFFLDSPDEVNDIDYTPYISFVIPTDKTDLFFVVGKIFDKKYRPYYSDEEITVDKDGIFAIVSESSEVDIEYRKHQG